MRQWRLHPDFPIFGVSDGHTHAAYVPGQVMRASAALLERLAEAWRHGAMGRGAVAAPTEAALLAAAASEAQQAWETMHRGPFDPICLNVQLPYRCNLTCAYCYARPSVPPSVAVSLNRGAVAAAARLVATNSARRALPLQLVIQGLGEPTLAWQDLCWTVEASRAAASEAGGSWQGHLSTNGQLEPVQAAWLAASFSHITVSCDGPPDLQDAARPRADGQPSSDYLRRSVAVLRDGPALLEARVTVTAANANRLLDVVGYIACELGISAIRLEPVFTPPASLPPLPPPETLAQSILDASRSGAALGADVDVASPRLTLLHGTYCEASRETLRLLPDGSAANCIRGVCAGYPLAVLLGRQDGATGAYHIDQEAADRACEAAGQVPQSCRDCLALYHCARNCPVGCPQSGETDDHRCRLQRHLATSWVLAAAARSPNASPGVAPARLEARLRRVTARLPEVVERESLVAATLRAATYYALDEHEMPAPAWVQAAARAVGSGPITELLAAAHCRRGPISVYVHLPFCRRKCVFCDCHSVVAGEGRLELHRSYVEALISDLDRWCGEGGMAGRPVTTIHFGGGTPDTMGYPLLSELTAALERRLAVTAQTEWAIETTAAHSSPWHLQQLLAIGFSRLHVGVQTLETGLRERLGRVTPSETVLEYLTAAMAAGMVTSVDLMYGLPEQSPGSLVADLARLSGLGIHGLSLYRLNLSSQNRGLLRTFPRFEPVSLCDCLMFQSAEQVLLAAGYAKNHYVHYALAPDANCYFRHATRGEDLLALGASAAGQVGDMEYRCHPYPDYMKFRQDALPLAALASHGLSPGAATLGAWLMSGSVPESLVAKQAAALLESRWLPAGVLAPQPGRYRLTATGSWLIGALLREIRQPP